MTFNSLDFGIFFLIVLVLCRLWPGGRILTLLIASFVFYSWLNWRFGVILFAMSVVGYFGPMLMERARSALGVKLIMFATIALILSPLFGLKYWDFVARSMEQLLAYAGLAIALLHINRPIPPGISFHSFQLIAYVVDIYRKKFPIERRPGPFFLYSSFFPQLVAGPIERPKHLLPQLYEAGKMAQSDVAPAFQFFLYGLFLKAAIADVVGIKVDQIYASADKHGGAVLFAGTALFYLQIYCDFAGYSLMAIGVARALGVRLVRNFNQPLLATSPVDFWHRWHISLSQWFRDYIYIPLGGNRGTTEQWIAAILLTFLLSGLWHGANFTFVAWGAVHGLAVLVAVAIIHISGDRARNPLLIIIAWLGTQLFATLSWVYFRAETIGKAHRIIKSIGQDFLITGQGWRDLVALPSLLDASTFALIIGAALFGWMLYFDRVVGRCGEDAPMAQWSVIARLAAQGAMIIATAFAWFFMPTTAAKPFIYFQF